MSDKSKARGWNFQDDVEQTFESSEIDRPVFPTSPGWGLESNTDVQEHSRNTPGTLQERVGMQTHNRRPSVWISGSGLRSEALLLLDVLDTFTITTINHSPKTFMLVLFTVSLAKILDATPRHSAKGCLSDNPIRTNSEPHTRAKARQDALGRVVDLCGPHSKRA